MFGHDISMGRKLHYSYSFTFKQTQVSREWKMYVTSIFNVYSYLKIRDAGVEIFKF